MGYEIFFITNEFVVQYNKKDKNWNKKGFNNGYKGKRFQSKIQFFVNIYNSWRELSYVDADAYFQRASGAMTGILALFCKMKGKSFFYMVASSQDVDRSYIKNTGMKNKVLYKYGLRNADCIFVQTKDFKKLLYKNHKLESYFIRDGIHIPKKIKLYHEKKYITFIGGVRPVKNPEIFISLAKKYPNSKFLMIGGPLANQKKYYSTIEKLAKKEKNIIFKGHLRRDRIGHYLSESLVLVNTSDREGLPNTITEAWSYGVPVIGLNINPDNLLNGDLGFYCKGDFNLMVEYVNELMGNSIRYEKISGRCLNYIINNHNIHTISKQIDKVLKTKLLNY